MVAPAEGVRGRAWPLPETVVALWVLAIASLTTLGADLLWAVAVGDDIRATGTVPQGLPFAAAPQVDWPNPIVLGELLLSLVHSLGTPALAAFHLALVAATLAVLVVECRRLGGGELRTAVVLTLVVVGGSASLVVVRLPGLSLLPFVLLVALLRRQHEHPTRRLWLVVPLVALWGNLHGGVLVGVAVLAVFLLASPGGGPLVRRVGVGVASVAALFATSAGTRTLRYYLGVFDNEARARGTDLWAPPSLTSPLDLAMVLGALVLVVMAARRRMPLWEWLVVGGIVVQTVLAARNGIWLLLFAAPAAAAALRRPEPEPAGPPEAPVGRGRVVTATAVAGAVASLVVLVARGAAVGPRGEDLVPTIHHYANGRTVLADEPLAETLAQGGVTVWASNPIDAFPRDVQGEFLDFLHDGTVPVGADVGLVAVSDGLVVDVERSGRWVVAAREGGYTILVRR